MIGIKLSSLPFLCILVSHTLKTEVLKITLEASFLTLPKSARRDNTWSVTQTPREVSRS